MKKIIYSFLVVLLIVSCNNDDASDKDEQACDNGTFVGDVFLSTQQEVDDFGALCYSKIDGDLKLGHESTFSNLNDIHDLTSLRSLKEVTGRFDIFHTENLQSLSGLDGLKTIDYLGLFHNVALTDVSAIGNLLNISGGINFQQNDILKNFIGLEGIKRLKYLGFSNNPELTSLDGFDGLENIDGILRLNGNNKLASIKALKNVRKLGSFDMYRCDNLESLEGLEGLESLGRLTLTNNSVFNLDVFLEPSSNMTKIDTIDIYDAPFSNLRGLFNLQTSNLVRIRECSNLLSLKGLEYLRNVKELHIESNSRLNDYCDLRGLIADGFYDSIVIEENQYNPSELDIGYGNCSQ